MRFRVLAELALPVAVALLAWLAPKAGPALWAIPSRLLRRFAGTRLRAILWSAVLSFAVCPILSWVRAPDPGVHDEFSYLLASDTFAHGRLTNPTHPLWEHFESFHINLQPTYQSKYPPGQGLFMAAGQIATGKPIVGVWLSVAAAAAAVCWMLLALMPPRWAFFGALLPAFRFGTLPLWDEYLWFAYWSTSFWGGAVTMVGGALLFGALFRLLRKPLRRDACWLGMGLLVLANTRPYEGLVVSLPVALVLAGWAVGHRHQWRSIVSRVVVPLVGVLCLGALAMTYYNYRGTGHPLKMPYLAYTEQYEVAPLFIFQPRGPDKTYNHEVFHEYQYEFMMGGYDRKKSGFGIEPQNILLAMEFYWGAALVLPLLTLIGRPWNRSIAFSAGVSVLIVLANAISSSERMHIHYLAPAAPLFVFLPVEGLRRLRALRLGNRHTGRPLSEAIIVICILSFLPACGLRAYFGPHHSTVVGYRRPHVIQMLRNHAGKDLVIVTYGSHHSILREWVYNDADIDASDIVWARDMGPEKNEELLEYYDDRSVWRLHADEVPPRLEPYPTGQPETH